MQISEVLITHTCLGPKSAHGRGRGKIPHIIPIMVNHFLFPSNTLGTTTTSNYKNTQNDESLDNRTISFQFAFYSKRVPLALSPSQMSVQKYIAMLGL